MDSKKPAKYFNADRDKICKFCDIGFSSDKTLSAHMCPKKRRMSEQDTVASRIAYYSYVKFHETVMKSNKKHSFEEFIGSKHYIGFLKLGRFAANNKLLSSEAYTVFLFKNGVKMHRWCDADVYSKFVEEYLTVETAEKAVERSVLELESWSQKTNAPIADYFEQVTTIEAVYAIGRGLISPWLLYLSSGGGVLLGRLLPEQIDEIMPYINPKVWENIFNRKTHDVEFFRTLLGEYGL